MFILDEDKSRIYNLDVMSDISCIPECDANGERTGYITMSLGYGYDTYELGTYTEEQGKEIIKDIFKRLETGIRTYEMPKSIKIENNGTGDE